MKENKKVRVNTDEDKIGMINCELLRLPNILKEQKKNKKGTLFIGAIFAIFFFMLGMWMLPFLKDVSTDARTNSDCTNSSISDGAKVTCLFQDIGVPYFIVAILTLVGGLIGNEL